MVTELVLMYCFVKAKINTSCSQPIGPGLISGDFEVISGKSLMGGPLCPIQGDCDSSCGSDSYSDSYDDSDD